MKNFDTYVGIDWSGAKAVHTNAIAVGHIRRTDPHLTLIENSHHRYWSRRDVFEWLASLVGRDERVLVGIDCNFGYVHAVGATQFGAGFTFTDVWRAVEIASEGNNFYASGFWENSEHAPYFWTAGKQPHWFDASALRRQTEQQCIQDGYGMPESPFKLIGARQVGKGGLAGMRMAYALKERHGDAIAVWPFERDKVDHAQVVLTEIFPRQFLKRFEFGSQKVRDENAFRSLLTCPHIMGIANLVLDKAQSISDHDTDALISAVGLKYLCGDGKHVPKCYTEPHGMKNHHALCEGWIFGVGDQDLSL